MTVVKLGPAPVDLQGIRAGDKNEIMVTITRSGRAVDLTGVTVTAQARRTLTTVAKLDATITILDATKGKLSMRWPGAAVTTWMATDTHVVAVWDMQMVVAGSDPITWAAGKFEAEMDVTR